MSKKLALTLGTILFLPVLVGVLLLPGPTWQASAARPESYFSPPFKISYDPAANASQKVRALHAPDGHLHAVWMDGALNTATGPAYSRGQGTQWPAWEWVGPASNLGYVNPTLALDSQGTVHVTWAYRVSNIHDIVYAYKPVGGSWSTPENLSNDNYNTVYSSMAIDSQDRLWVAWQSSHTEADEEIYVRSKPAGGAWEPVMRVTFQASKDQNPSIVVDANDIPHLAWRSTAMGGWEILCTRYIDGAWRPFENISATAAGSHFPRLAADNAGNVFAAWMQETGSDQFRTAVRRWNNGAWAPRTFASVAGIKALYPDIAVDNAGVVYVVWTDYRSSPTEVYFNHSTDYGQTWATDENVSRSSSSSSFFPSVAAAPGGFAHIFWQENPGMLDILYSWVEIPGIEPPTPIPSPSPTPTTPAIPYGGINVVALQPPANQHFTRQAQVQLNLWAESPAGHDLLMRYANLPDFGDNPGFVSFAPLVPSWNLAVTPNVCATKTVYAQFQDAVDGTVSAVYSDQILYDDWLTATLALNGGNAYTNRSMVKLDSENRDREVGCSGLYAMQFREETITYTSWYSYLPGLWYFLQPSGPETRTIYGQYQDRAGNIGTLARQITLDLAPPYNGTPPTMPAWTDKLLITVSNLQATDDASGVGYVWLANNCSPEGQGSWLALPYCASPPCSYTWNLGYGGPPLDGVNRVCVKYEDRTGYGGFRGNFSAIYEGTITVSGIQTVFLPLVARGAAGGLAEALPVAPTAADLFLWTDASPAGPDQEVLLYLVWQGRAAGPHEGTLRMQLPAGLHVVSAWSAYGELQHVGAQEVRSRERAAPGQVAWITVLARVAPGAAPHLPVQGDLTGAAETLTAPPLWLDGR